MGRRTLICLLALLPLLARASEADVTVDHEKSADFSIALTAGGRL